MPATYLVCPAATRTLLAAVKREAPGCGGEAGWLRGAGSWLRRGGRPVAERGGLAATTPVSSGKRGSTRCR